jgi:ankyrin repeat protein
MSLEEKLIGAAKHGDSETVTLLLERGADIRAIDDLALRWAAGNGHTKTVALLLERGANINAKKNQGLRGAADGGHTQTVALLLGRDADIHAENDEALRWAALNGHTETVALLLKHYKTKEIEKWANPTRGGPDELAVKPFAQKEYKKRTDCIKAQKVRDSEPEITL